MTQFESHQQGHAMAFSCIGLPVFILVLMFTKHTASAQWENIVTCHENYIDLRPEDGWGGTVPICMDTFRIGRTPAKRPHTSMVDSVCARLFRVPSSNAISSRVEIAAETICEGPNLVTVIPKTPLAATDNQGRVIWYLMEQYCSYWHGSQDIDTTRFVFTKATGCKAYATAIDIETGEDITALRLVAPDKKDMDHYIDPGVQLTAYEGAGYHFVEWTSTDEHLLLSRTAYDQTLLNRCWPVLRAVEFIGKFRKVTSAIESPRDIDASLIDIGKSLIRVTDRTSDASIVDIYNARGSLLVTQPIVDGLAQLNVETFPTGMFVIIVKGTNQTRVHSFIHLKE